MVDFTSFMNWMLYHIYDISEKKKNTKQMCVVFRRVMCF